MGGFSVDTDSLRSAGRAIQFAADELDEAIHRFAQQLSGVGDPWGMDLLGTLIGGGYTATEDVALKTYDSVVAALDEASEGLVVMAENYGAVEDRNLAIFDVLREQM